ncbi:MAG: precorrin-3B C(17)-methyltransferase, partial [Kiloniellales bacterium]|nr:precorrin-3B C(17)-methyltransferase [Kiloniellales bacterium]
AERLEAERARLATPSELVFREVGCHGVAEGAALAAVGGDGELILPKRKSRRATCAIGLASSPLPAEIIGRAPGHLAVVGLGPGDEVWRAPEVDLMVRGADDLVGYSLYLDLLGSLGDGKIRHDFALGEEEARVRHALELAAGGRKVVLICSGDPGIYAMASLVFELLDREERADWMRLEIKVVPGISALQAASARIGAPLGHDFCTISLSDLLTPWEVIEKRIRTAAEGDFVIAFYNPVSRRRRGQFVKAMEILRQHRSGDTPVVIGRNLGREAESLRVTSLAKVTVDDIDMLSLVLVGSMETKEIEREGKRPWVYTPRGYAAKTQSPAMKFKKGAG